MSKQPCQLLMEVESECVLEKSEGIGGLMMRLEGVDELVMRCEWLGGGW